MKNFCLVLLAVLLTTGISTAQEAAKTAKKASKLLNSYNLDQSSNAAKLGGARSTIDEAFATGELDEASKAWTIRGKVYNELAVKQTKEILTNTKIAKEDEGVALTSYESFLNALKFAVKGYEKKDALKGLAEVAGNLNSIGYFSYQSGKYLDAFKQFDAVIKINDLLQENGMKAILGDDKSYNDQLYITAVSAMSGGNMDNARDYFLILKDKGFTSATMYDGLYKAYKDSDEEKALGYLAEGREKNPEETSLLFSEINHYLQKGELNSLIVKLEKAAELEPDNASIFTTLANVYDQQYQTALEEGDDVKTKELFESAYSNYSVALEKDPSDFAATYSLGALYYNNAAAVSKEVNTLADDYTPAGTKKYEAKKAEMFSLFDKALPYFEKAEVLNGVDMNTLIALKEIYARKDMFEKSNVYKAKIEALKN